MNIVLCLSHSIEEHDQLRLLHELGYNVFSIGGYIDPAHPHDPKRPALPQIPHYPHLQEAVDSLGTLDNLGNAQRHIPAPILEWADVIIFHHYLDERLYPQWDDLAEWRAGGGRIIWRTVGQSTDYNEFLARPYREDGLEIVRYSPKERSIPGYCGEDAMIRFWKDPEEWGGWVGDQLVVTNITQQLKQRHPWTNYAFWHDATARLDTWPVGPGSEAIGGPGEVSYDEMRQALQRSRCYLYTGTQPASYTLGLIEALMTGIPVISIGPRWMQIFPFGKDLYEGHELAGAWSDLSPAAGLALQRLIEDDDLAQTFSKQQRSRTIKEFGRENVGAAWREYLGAP